MFLGIDLGTSCVKVALFDPKVSGCATSATWPETGELARSAPQPGWAEQDPTDWWNAVVAAIRCLPLELVAQVEAIGITYQMHGLVLLSEGGDVVRPAILWCDDRAVASGEQIAAELSPSTREALMNEPGNFTLAKLRWVRNHEPDQLRKARWAMLPGDYIAYRLTGTPSTTFTGLSEMIAWDFDSRCASDEAWSAAAGDTDLRPELAPMMSPFGTVSATASAETRIPTGIPIAYRCGDQPNNAYSLGVDCPGTLAAVAGTSGVLYGVSEQAVRDPENRVNTFLHVTDTESEPRNGVLMCINGAGSSYSWLSQTLVRTFNELNQMAESVPVGCDGLQVFPFGNGAERILGNRSVGGNLTSLHYTTHGLPHLARGTLEGVAFTMRFGLDIMEGLGVKVERIRAGNASLFRSSLFSQIFCDTMNRPLELLDTDGALGAARGACAGLTGNSPPASAVKRAIAPGTDTEYEDQYQSWRAALERYLSSQD